MIKLSCRASDAKTNSEQLWCKSISLDSSNQSCSLIYLSVYFSSCFGKNWAIEKLPVPSFVTPVFPYCISAIFVYKKRGEKRENIYFMSVRSGSESPVSFSRWGCSGFLFLPFFRPHGKPWYQYMEAITRRRDTVVTLPHMSEIQMTSIQCATELRIIAAAPLWGRLLPYCALVFFHLPAVSSRKHPAGRGKTRPDLDFLFCTHCT